MAPKGSPPAICVLESYSQSREHIKGKTGLNIVAPAFINLPSTGLISSYPPRGGGAQGEKDKLHQVPGPPCVSLKARLSERMHENSFLCKPYCTLLVTGVHQTSQEGQFQLL